MSVARIPFVFYWFIWGVLQFLGPAEEARAAEGGPADAAALRAYHSANGLLNRGMFDLAAAEYRTFLREFPEHEKSAVARYGLAVCLYRQNQFAEARAELERIANANEFGYAAEVQAMLGQCQMAADDFAAAAETFERFGRRHGDHALAPDVAGMLVEALHRCGKHAEAARAARVFEERWATHALRERVLLFRGLAHLALKEWSDAAGALDSLLKTYPQSAYRQQAVFCLAQCHDQQNALAEAARWYRRTLEQANGRYVPDALLGLAALLEREGKAGEAAPLLDRLLDEFGKSPLRPQALLLRGRVAFDQGEFARAAEIFEQAAEEDSGLADEATYWGAKCALRQDDAAAAARELERALNRYPDSSLLPEMRYDLAVALLQQKEYEQAAQVLERFRAKHAEHELSPAALHLAAVAAHHLEQHDRSAALCREFMSQYSEHALAADTGLLAAENAFLDGDDAAAETQYRAFLGRFPQHGQAVHATLRLGTALYRQQKLDEAADVLAKIVARAEGDAALRPALLTLGDIHFQRGEWKEAETHLRRYLDGPAAPPAADDALLKLALSVRRQGQTGEALHLLERLLAEFPKSTHRLHAIFESGQLLAEMQRGDEAQAAFELVLKEGPDSRFAAYTLNHLGALALQRGDEAAAAERFAAVAGRAAPDALRAGALLQRGQALLAAGDYAAAEKVLVEFLKQHSEDAQAPAAQAQLAIAVSRQDRPENALSLIKHAEGNDLAQLSASLRSALLYEKAWCLRKLGKSDEAAAAYRVALAQKDAPPAQRAHATLELAELRAAAGDCAAAAQLLEPLVKDGARDLPAQVAAPALYRLGACAFEGKTFDEAVRWLDRFLQAYSDHPLAASASFFCGEANFQLGQHKQASEHLRRVVESFPNDPAFGPSLLRLGEALAALQYWDRSERSFERYLKDRADSEHWYQAQFGVGWARENQGRPKEAIKAYEAVVERHQGPTAARAQFQIGQCLFEMKDYEAAVRALLKVDILYAYPEWSAAALYEAGRCFEHLGKLVEARRQFETVREKYKETRWAELATERLAAVAGDGLPGKSAMP